MELAAFAVQIIIDLVGTTIVVMLIQALICKDSYTSLVNQPDIGHLQGL